MNPEKSIHHNRTPEELEAIIQELYEAAISLSSLLGSMHNEGKTKGVVTIETALKEIVEGIRGAEQELLKRERRKNEV